MPPLPESSEPISFSGHESFPLRYAWLKKGYDAISKDANCFNHDDAILKLGVGKNMVRAIRHWGIACRIWHSDRGDISPTELGQKLFADSGWDPYLDDPATLWLLQWQLASQKYPATSWWYLFARQRVKNFHRDELIKELMDLSKAHTGRIPSESTIKRDVEVMLRTYVRAKGSSEDDLDSPLVQLGLLHPGDATGKYTLSYGSHPSLPTAIVHAAIMDWCRLEKKTGDAAISLEDLLHHPGSPGRVFRLSENAFLDHLQTIEESTPQFQFTESAGIRQILIQQGAPDFWAILSSYYSNGEGQ
jgi:hypothetical protein